ncbi:MAG TPA: EamA family transporter [Mycobacteriales bacterium]|nr:EamA family transporter [Mycobacteriales bacterium]
MSTAPSRAKIWLALWAVYLLWGSTYLAIRVAVHPSHGHGLPPLMIAGARFTLAGGLMLVCTWHRPAPDGKPDPLGARQWYAAAIIGLALAFGGNGLVSIAEKRIPSGTAAVILATIPILVALIAAALGRERLGATHLVGLVLGFAGVAALVVGTGSGRISVAGTLIVVLAALSWASGSVYSTTAPTVRRPLVATGMQMLCGGIGCFIGAAASGEFAGLHSDEFTLHALLAFTFLVVAGSLVAYTAYVWLLRNAELSLVTTYAFVNPVVAVILGATILSEPFTIRSVIATVAVVIAVIVILRRKPAMTAPDEAIVPAPDEVAV